MENVTQCRDKGFEMDTASNEWLRTIGENDQLWATHLERIPNMICIAFKHLRKLAKDGKVYGTMLQCKDIFELICKTPVIMALISLEGTQGYKDTDIYFDIIRACLETPMSMGDWNSLAGIMVKKQNEINLPENVYQIIKRTRRLYQERISNTAANVVNWRNNTIGHGVLKFEDDDTYKQELSCLLNLLREYFDGQKKYSIRGLYDNLYFLLDEKCLIGEYWSDEIKEGKVQLAFDGLKTSTANYLVNQNYKYYLFDAFYTVGAQSKKYIQMAANVADSIIKIKRTSKFNVELLTEYIKRIDRSITSNNIDALILRSDYRFLYLKAILSVRESYPFDNSDETQFIRSFMDYTCSFYGINHRTKIEEIAVTIALFPDISLHDYKKYIACQEITYEFVGLLNNLLPLMTATHRNGDTYYSFADQA